MPATLLNRIPRALKPRPKPAPGPKAPAAETPAAASTEEPGAQASVARLGWLNHWLTWSIVVGAAAGAYFGNNIRQLEMTNLERLRAVHEQAVAVAAAAGATPPTWAAPPETWVGTTALFFLILGPLVGVPLRLLIVALVIPQYHAQRRARAAVQELSDTLTDAARIEDWVRSQWPAITRYFGFSRHSAYRRKEFIAQLWALHCRYNEIFIQTPVVRRWTAIIAGSVGGLMLTGVVAAMSTIDDVPWWTTGLIFLPVGYVGGWYIGTEWATKQMFDILFGPIIIIEHLGGSWKPTRLVRSVTPYLAWANSPLARRGTAKEGRGGGYILLYTEEHTMDPANPMIYERAYSMDPLTDTQMMRGDDQQAFVTPEALVTQMLGELPDDATDEEIEERRLLVEELGRMLSEPIQGYYGSNASATTTFVDFGMEAGYYAAEPRRGGVAGITPETISIIGLALIVYGVGIAGAMLGYPSVDEITGNLTNAASSINPLGG